MSESRNSMGPGRTGASVAAPATASAAASLASGRKICMTAMPISTPIALVAAKKSRLRPPSWPRRLRSPSVPTPTKITTTTSGMTTIFSRSTKAWPIGSIPVATRKSHGQPVIDATRPSSRPATRPSATAV
jgi:hypothetical protein